MGYLYKNETIHKDNFELVVTVFGMGQGNCNMIEIYDKSKPAAERLVQLMMIDLGTDSSKDYVNLENTNHGVFSTIHDAMQKRANAVNASIPMVTNQYYAYMDMFFLTHQDEDHQNKIEHLIKYLSQAQSSLSLQIRGKYINNMYLSGFDYAEGISKALMSHDETGARSEGDIRKAVIGNIYHLSHENASITKEIPPKAVRGVNDVTICLYLLMSNLRNTSTYTTQETPFNPNIYGVNYFDKRPLEYTVGGSKMTIEREEDAKVNFFSLDKTHGTAITRGNVNKADIRNTGSSILHLSVKIPGLEPFSYIFTGDSQHKTYVAFKKIYNTDLPSFGKVILFTIPHHGSYRTTASGKSGSEFNDFTDFVKKFNINKTANKMLVSMATGQIGRKSYGHPNIFVLNALLPYCEDGGAIPDHGLSYYCHDDNKKEVTTTSTTTGVYNTEYINYKSTDVLPIIISDITDAGAKFTVKRNHFQFKADKTGAAAAPVLVDTDGYIK